MGNSTNRVMIGSVAIGGGAPVSVQSMTTHPTQDTQGVLSQINDLVESGCELVRVAVPHRRVLDSFAAICEQSPIPVIADIHFDHVLAIEAAKRGAAKLRINPGNIGSMAKVDEVIQVAGEAKIPIRIGVNAGSLQKEIEAHHDWDLASKLVASALGFVEYFEARDFTDIVVSAKAHNVPTTIETYQALSREIPHVPLHIGVTETGTLTQGTVKSAVGLGMLLAQGIGDTMRVSLTADPCHECEVGWEILASLGLRRRSAEIVSCPTCARCEVDLIELANTVNAYLKKEMLPISVAVMGCVVNGPGEAKDADIGVACGKNRGVIFAHGEVVRSVPEAQILQALFEEIDARYQSSLVQKLQG